MSYLFVSFNIRVNTMFDGKQAFDKRVPYILDKIKKEKPDLIAFQELTDEMLKKLSPLFVDYDVVGHGRNKDLSGESVRIFYLRSEFFLLQTKTFWLSRQPLKPGSRFKKDQSRLPRITTYAKFRLKNNKVIAVFNTHYDHEGKDSRFKASQLMLKKINEFNKGDKLPLIMMGDLNALKDAIEIKIISNKLNDLSKNIAGTFHNFGKLKSPAKIDYIFGNSKIKVLQTGIWDDLTNDIYLSDHYPIYVLFTI
ncbi:MAG: endonuclease/exonuclease/phosphatase family protein [Acholeplasmataceae bacterium]|nr:endonuclease/exonuclease/phosphatase family protein [Acholeplasmataceae bacterium]